MPLSRHELEDFASRGERAFRKLAAMEIAGVRTSILIGPASQWAVVTGLQLASRNPDVSPGMRKKWEDMAYLMARGLGQLDKDAQMIINAGFDPDLDVLGPGGD